MHPGLLQAYIYFAITALITFLLCAYIYHLYTSKKKGGTDYEKYSDLVLNDSIKDVPLESVISHKAKH